jgi:putative ABC transport system substrate-binding protein
MKRREFIALAGGAALSRPFVGNAQQREPLRRVGAIIGFAQKDPEVDSFINAFDKGLKELGWNDGDNVQIDYRYAAGDIGAMQRLTQEMVALRPDVIFASSTPITAALHRESQTIPVVFVVVSDPVGAGIVASLSRPGGNITGLINVESSMSGKWVELLKEIAPSRLRH